MALLMTSDTKERIKDLGYLYEFLKTDEGQKWYRNYCERQCKKIILETEEKLIPFVLERTAYYCQFWRAKWRIDKAVYEDVFRHFGFIKRPSFLGKSNRTLDRHSIEYYREILMAEIIKKANAQYSDLDWKTLEYHTLEEQQKALSKVYGVNEAFVQVSIPVDTENIDPIRLVKLIHKLPDTDTAEELLFREYLKSKHKNTELKLVKEKLGSEPISIQRLQYEASGYYTKVCSICGEHITIKKDGPHNDDHSAHSCETDI